MCMCISAHYNNNLLVIQNCLKSKQAMNTGKLLNHAHFSMHDGLLMYMHLYDIITTICDQTLELTDI